jgi:hypothetical protein
MFNELHCIVEIKQSKMDFVKHFKPDAFDLFKHAVTSFKEYYSKEMPTHAQITRYSIYNNGVFKLEGLNFIAVEFTGDNFNNFFEKHI